MSENPSVPFMEHPFHPVTIKQLSDKVKSRMRNGHAVRISPTAMGHKEGEGLPIIVHADRFSNITRCIKSGKGLQLKLSPEELSENGKIMGCGIFGKKADKFLEKHGVKKLAYAVGSAVKPFAQKAITSAGAYFGGPLGTLASQTANDYLDNPEMYQKMVRDEMKGSSGAPTGNYKAKAIDMLAERLKASASGEPTTIGALDKAGMSKMLADKASAELAKRTAVARASPAGMGLYAGRGLGVGLYGAGISRRREYHSIGGRHSIMGQGVPALESQPYGVNYQFRTQMPPAFQRRS
jgi:hypothetical protein